jgi:hypothetical protein
VSDALGLRVNRSLDLLASLKQTAAKFAKREDLLSRELSSRRYAANRTSQETLESTESAYAAKITQTDDYFYAQASRIKSIYDKRRARVQRFSSTSLRNLPARGQEVKGRWLGDLQMKNYNAQRRLPLDLAAADADYAGFTSKLEAHWATLLGLERLARKYFRGYWTLGSLLRRKRRADLAADISLSERLEAIRDNLATAEAQLQTFPRFPLARFFSYAPLPLFFVLIFGGAAALAWYLGFAYPSKGFVIVGVSAFVTFGVVWFIHFLGDWKNEIIPIYQAIDALNAGKDPASLGLCREIRPDLDQVSLALPLALTRPFPRRVRFSLKPRLRRRRRHRHVEQHHPAAALDHASRQAQLHHHRPGRSRAKFAGFMHSPITRRA